MRDETFELEVVDLRDDPEVIGCTFTRCAILVAPCGSFNFNVLNGSDLLDHQGLPLVASYLALPGQREDADPAPVSMSLDAPAKAMLARQLALTLASR